MSQNTTISGLPWPELADEPNIETAVKPLAEELDDKIITRFSTTTERDSAITAPEPGMTTHVATHGLTYYGPESAWVPLPGVLVVVVTRAAAQSMATGGSGTAISWDTTSLAPWGGHSTGTNPTRVTLPFKGYYRVQYVCSSTAGAFTGVHQVELLKNGVLVGSSRVRESASGACNVDGEAFVYANGSTDYFEVRYFHNHSAAQNTGTAESAPQARFEYKQPIFA